MLFWSSLKSFLWPAALNILFEIEKKGRFDRCQNWREEWEQGHRFPSVSTPSEKECLWEICLYLCNKHNCSIVVTAQYKSNTYTHKRDKTMLHIVKIRQFNYRFIVHNKKIILKFWSYRKDDHILFSVL